MFFPTSSVRIQSIFKMDTLVERYILPVLGSYRNNPVRCKLMTSQVAQCLILQMTPRLDFGSERVNQKHVESFTMTNFTRFIIILVNS